MISNPQLYDKFVAFVDILGFRSKVEAVEKGEGITLPELLELCSILSQEMYVSNVAEYGPIICPESRGNSRNLDYEVTQISDCVVISAEISPAGIINLLQHVSASVMKLMTKGIMLRGYITRGNIYHKGNQIIGTGYQSAFDMERKVSAFRLPFDSTSTPFVEIDKSVIAYVSDETDQCVREVFGRLTKEDENGIVVIFPFQRLSDLAGQSIMNAEACKESLCTIRKWITDFLRKLESQSPSTGLEAGQKSTYYRKFLKEQLDECDRIEEVLHMLKQPAVEARYGENLDVVWDC